MNLLTLCLSIIIVLLSFLTTCSSIRWHMHPDTQKCLKEELKRNELVKGVYDVIPIEGQQVDYIVRDSNNHILSQKEDISSGKFTFSIENNDMFEICFISRLSEEHFHRGIVQEVYLDIKSGIEAKNYEGVAEAAKLKPLELSLKRLEDISQDIVEEFNDMKKRADEMRDTNESTNNRIFYLSLCSITCLILLATWQLFYLRRYFKAKKLIE